MRWSGVGARMRPIVARLLRFTLFDYDGDGAGDRWSNYVEATTHGHFERSRKRVDGLGECMSFTSTKLNGARHVDGCGDFYSGFAHDPLDTSGIHSMSLCLVRP